MGRSTRAIAVAAIVTIATLITVGAQAGGGANWPTVGADAQRSSWMRTETKLSAATFSGSTFQFLWKAKLENTPVHLNALTQPLLLQNLISHKGFKALAFVGGSGDVAYAIDYDLNRIYWKQALSTAVRTGSSTVTCPGGLTAMTRAARLNPQAGGRGGPGAGGRGPQPAPAPGARGAPGPGQPGPPPNRGGINANNLPMNNATFAISSGGMLHFLNPHVGGDIEKPIKFFPPRAKVSGFIQVDNVLYAATSDNCGGAPNGVWAMDLANKARPITRWESAGSIVGTTGPAFATDGTVFAATGAAATASSASAKPESGASANSVVSLEPRSLKLRDYFNTSTPFTTSPIVFRLKDRDVVAAANSDGRIYVLDGKALGGADHTTVFARSDEYGALPAETPQALATWEEPNGNRWILAPAKTGVVAFTLVERGDAVLLERAWTSRAMSAPSPLTVFNDVVFVVDGGLAPDDAKTPTAERVKRAGAAVLYALDGRTGKELWNSGTTITSFTHGVAPSAGDSQVYVVTYDGTLYTFGLPMER
jgi:PQQ-like domain